MRTIGRGGIRRWGCLVAGIVAVTLAVPGVYFAVLCIQNASHEDAWRVYIATHPASTGVEPSPDPEVLERYEDTSWSFVSPRGETRSPYGYRTQDGHVVIEAAYAACAWEFSEGLAWALTQDWRWVYIKPDGGIAFEIDAIGLFDFSEGMARFRVRGPNGMTRDGFVNTRGQVVIPAHYEDARDFIGDYALVSESTALTRMLEAFVMKTGIGIDVCFASRKRILDHTGTTVSPDALTISSHP
ncbi:MAG: hypothetical protein DHS20C14_03310 [Phycisphaeraceae bacterium]|nr:MAG: hypothetical protein DHS20C14_03310 [Phycisphaeraceae bacterium]